MSDSQDAAQDSEKFFLLQRRSLLTVSLLIILYDLGLSFLVNAVYGENLAQAKKGSLLAVLLVWCVYALIRYHHGVRDASKWEVLSKGYKGYKRIYLWRGGYVSEEISEGRSNLTNEDWHHLENEHVAYIVKYDHDMQRVYIKKARQKDFLSGISYVFQRVKIAWFSLRAFIKFSRDGRHVFDILVPYVVGLFAVLEALGWFKITRALTVLGSYLHS